MSFNEEILFMRVVSLPIFFFSHFEIACHAKLRDKNILANSIGRFLLLLLWPDGVSAYPKFYPICLQTALLFIECHFHRG